MNKLDLVVMDIKYLASVTKMILEFPGITKLDKLNLIVKSFKMYVTKVLL